MSTTSQQPAAGLGQQVTRAVRWNALLPVKIAASSAAALVMANGLRDHEYGTVVLVTSLAGLLGSWIDLGIERSLPKFYPEVEAQAGRTGLLRFIRQIALVKLVVVSVVVLAMLASREWFFSYWSSQAKDPTAAQMLTDQQWLLFLTLVGLLVIGAIFDVLMQVLVAFFQQKEFNLINLGTSTIQPLLLVAAVLLGLGIPGLMVVLIAVPLGGVVVALGAAHTTIRGVQSVGKNTLRPGFYRRLAHHALITYGLQLATVVQSFNFAILFVGSLGAVGEFRVGYFLPAQVLQILFAPLNGVQVPLFSRLREAGDEARTHEVYVLLSRFLLVTFCPAAVGVAILAQNLTNLLWPQFTGAAPVAVIMSISLFASSAITIARNILMVHEVYTPLIMSRVIGLVAVPLLILLPPQLGIVGAALAIGVASLGSEVAGWLWSMHRLRLSYPWPFAARVVIATAVMGAVAWPLARWVFPIPTTLSISERLGPGLASQLGIALLGALVYFAALRLLGGLEASDLAAVRMLRVPGSRYLLRVLT